MIRPPTYAPAYARDPRLDAERTAYIKTWGKGRTSEEAAARAAYHSAAVALGYPDDSNHGDGPTPAAAAIAPAATRATSAPHADVAVPAPKAAVQPAPAPAIATRPAAPVAAKQEAFVSHRYDNKELRNRVTRIFGSAASRGQEQLAWMLVGADTSIDAAITSLRIARGEQSYAASGTSSRPRLDAQAIFAARAEDCRRAAQSTSDASSGTASAPRPAGLDAGAIYARREADARRAAGR